MIFIVCGVFWLGFLAYLGRDQLDYPDDPERDPLTDYDSGHTL
jgi:hypothetical protein